MDNVKKPEAISVAATVTLGIAVTTLLALLGGLAWWFWATDGTTEWETVRPIIVAGFILWGIALSLLILGFIALRLFLKDKVSSGTTLKPKPAAISGWEATSRHLKNHLRTRYGLLWRRRVRLLLVTGEPQAIGQLVPGLRENHWLEGNGTVLIDGGSLTAGPQEPRYPALRRLRPGRPLDGIIRVLPAGQSLSLQLSDSDLRGLAHIGEGLHYQPPVWLWQLCSTGWSQEERVQQAVGASFPPRADAGDIARQLAALLPALTARGISQIADNTRHDFLLRLSQQLQEGGITRWVEQLGPWLASAQRRVVLRGLMFSLAQSTGAASAHPHALAPSPLWAGIEGDCARLRGHRVGWPRGRVLAWGYGGQGYSSPLPSTTP